MQLVVHILLDCNITIEAGCIGLRHFIYKSKKSSCLTSPRLPVLYCNHQQKERSARSCDRVCELRLWKSLILWHQWNIKPSLAWCLPGWKYFRRTMCDGKTQFLNCWYKKWWKNYDEWTFCQIHQKIMVLVIHHTFSAQRKSCFAEQNLRMVIWKNLPSSTFKYTDDDALCKLLYDILNKY